jgi:hypothetical protein
MTLFVRKWVLKPALILLLWVVGLVGTGVGLLLLNQERLVKLGVNELNKQIDGELIVETSKISLFKHFPSVGVSLRQGKVFVDKFGRDSAFFKFERLYVGISIPDLIDGKYNMRRLSLTNGNIQLVQEADGTINAVKAFTMRGDTTPSSSDDDVSFDIDLQKFSIKGTHISFLDKASGQRFATSIELLTSSFTSDSSRMAVTLVSDMEADFTSPDDTVLFRHKKVHVDITADYVIREKLLEVSAGSLQLQDAKFDVEGTANFASVPEVRFRINGNKPDFNIITAFVPGDVKELLKPFSYDGDINFESLVAGKISNDSLPHIEVLFGCRNGWFVNDDADERVDDLGFTGFYTNGAENSLHTSELHLINMNAKPGKGLFRGNFVLRDFNDPQILMQLQSELDLKFLSRFFGIRDLQQFTGKIKLNMDFKEIVDINMPEQSLAKLKEGIQSQLSIEDLSFDIPGYQHRVEDMNIHAAMKDGRITLDSARFRVGKSDLSLTGSIDDILAFVRNHKRPVSVNLNARSNHMALKELLSYDTALANAWDEDINKFNISLTLKTTVEQLLNPAPLPLGTFEMKHLRASFRKYPHTLKDLNASIAINDSMLMVHNFDGMVDSSDMKLSGQVKNYKLWFDSIMKGRTQIVMNFKSTRFALDDLTMKGHRRWIPRAWRHEQLNNTSLSATVNLRYDTVFRSARTEVTTLTSFLKNHKLDIKDVKGKVRYSPNRVLSMDTVTGTIGKTDFDLTMRIFNGEDKTIKKRTNYFYFTSKLLDLNEITAYDFSEPPRKKKDSTKAVVAAKVDTSHAKAFNVFTIPFSEFTFHADIGRLRYNKLGIKDLKARARITENHMLHIDTIGMFIAGGAIAIKGELNGQDTSRLLLSSTIRVDSVDLEKVMLKLDRFGQDVMVNKSLKGRMTGEVQSVLQVHPNLVPIVDNSKAKIGMTIYNGSLIDFAPMLAMAGYFKDKNLRVIRFDSLKNELSFEKGVLVIPSMNINSSIGAIEMSGKQSLDMKMEYYLRIPMKMVTQVGFSSLFDKKQEEVDLNQVDEIEYSDKDKKTRFVNLKVVGTPDDFRVSLGRARAGS